MKPTSSGWTSNAVVILNTIGAWLIMAAVIYRRPEATAGVVAAMSMIVLIVFCVERGFRHMDFKAGPDGFAAKLDDEPSAPPPLAGAPS